MQQLLRLLALENAICNQLRPYGGLNYLAKGNEYEIDFILTSGERAAGLEVRRVAELRQSLEDLFLAAVGSDTPGAAMRGQEEGQ